jgi:hypothetical protein
MARRQNRRRKNHRNEGQGKKQVNHKGKSPNRLLRRRWAQSAFEWTLAPRIDDGEWLVGGRAWPVGGRGGWCSRAHLSKTGQMTGTLLTEKDHEIARSQKRKSGHRERPEQEDAPAIAFGLKCLEGGEKGKSRGNDHRYGQAKPMRIAPSKERGSVRLHERRVGNQARQDDAAGGSKQISGAKKGFSCRGDLPVYGLWRQRGPGSDQNPDTQDGQKQDEHECDEPVTYK